MAEFQDGGVPLMIAATMDCSDLAVSAEFWSRLLHLEVKGIIDQFAFLSAAPDRKVAIWLQRVDEPKTGKNAAHLDFVAQDLEAAEKRVVELGGTLGERSTWQDFLWRTCRDPDGNEFDIMQAQST